MTLDSDLRDVLTERAQRIESDPPDLAVLRAGGLRIRRRRHRVVVASWGAAAVLVVGIGMTVAAGRGDPGATDLPAAPPSTTTITTGIPWCVGSGADLQVVGEGPPVAASCRPGRGTHLVHHAGTTLLAAFGTLDLVADGRRTVLGRGDGDVSMSHDGRLVASLSLADGRGNCGVLPLEVYAIAPVRRVAATEIGGPTQCGHLEGIDDRGRVYVSVSEGDRGPLDVRMYDIGRRQWTQVTGLPAAGTGVTYVTADGFAVQTKELRLSAPDYGDALALASVPGRVDDAGRFLAGPEVPLGRARWSLDRSFVLDQRPEGVVVLPADLSHAVALGLPARWFALSAGRLPSTDFLWESADTVLAVADPMTGAAVYRCDVISGSCRQVNQPGVPPLSNAARVGG